jgi:phage tail-like protein
MEQNSHVPKKKLLEYLPAIYQEPDSSERRNYLPAFLEPFEKILLGVEEKAHVHGETNPVRHKPPAQTLESLSEKIARLHELFDPWEAPEEFLPWLASWAALSLCPTLQPGRKRLLIAKIISLYRIRGTREYLEELLKICVDAPTAVLEEEIPPLQLGIHSTVGGDMYIGGGAPHYFRVRLVASNLNALELQAQRQLAYEVVELAKPAHTGYEFQVDSPQMQVGVHSTVGLDTVLGAAPAQLA